MYEAEVGGNVVDDYQNPMPSNNNKEESKEEESDGGSGSTN